MIVDIFLWLVGWVAALFAMTPNWLIYPDFLMDAIRSAATTIATFNFIFAIDTLFDCLDAVIWYFSLYIPFKLIIMFVNWMRGSGSIDI